MAWCNRVRRATLSSGGSADREQFSRFRLSVVREPGFHARIRFIVPTALAAPVGNF